VIDRILENRKKERPKLLFVSPQFLFPMDAGGKIRSVNILKNMKGGAFEISLLAPADQDEQERWANEIAEICDHFSGFEPDVTGLKRSVARVLALGSARPVAVRSEARKVAKQAVQKAMEGKPDLVIYDYVHAMAMKPEQSDQSTKTIFFAHNFETEIFRRHHQLATGIHKIIWGGEARKMERFERENVARVDGIIAVSNRDREAFRNEFGAEFVADIPTGVDLDFFSYMSPKKAWNKVEPPVIVFTGSLDWRANQDGLQWFMDEVWPLIIEKRPDAIFRIVGKNPPDFLVKAAQSRGYQWQFTGFVDDIRDHARGCVYVIPLRAGGGTRIKAFEAMAMGIPVVSTSLGIEGLAVTNRKHFLEADRADQFATMVLTLIEDEVMRNELSLAARALCEDNFSQQAAASAFEKICLEVLDA